MPGMAQKLHVKLDSTERLERTQSLWIRYYEHIQIVRDFIRAERLSDIQLHIGSSAKMLPVMMVAGHSQYGKAIRFILQQFINFKYRQKPSLSAINTTKSSFQATSGVAYGRTYHSNKLYSKALRQVQRWLGRRKTPHRFQKQWLLILTLFSSIHQSLEEKFSNERMTSDHADLSTKRMEDAYKKVTRLVTWFKTTQPTETDAKKLVSFSTGEVCWYEKVNWLN